MLSRPRRRERGRLRLRGRYLSVAGEGGVVKQEVDPEEHHNGVVHTQDGPVYEDGPAQQRVLRDVSEAQNDSC